MACNTPEASLNEVSTGISSATAISRNLGLVLDAVGGVGGTSCTNVTKGCTAFPTEVNPVIPNLVKFQFHSACDGKADVNGAATEMVFFP